MFQAIAAITAVSAFVCARELNAFGTREITIPLSDQGGKNSYGDNWFTVQRGFFIDRVVEMEEGAAGKEYVVWHGPWSFGLLKIKLEKET